MDNDTLVKKYHVERYLRAQAKAFLFIIEDLQKDHKIQFDKLYNSFPEDYDIIDLANYFDNEKFMHLRKRILDNLNDYLRGIEEYYK